MLAEHESNYAVGLFWIDSVELKLRMHCFERNDWRKRVFLLVWNRPLEVKQFLSNDESEFEVIWLSFRQISVEFLK